MKTSLVIALLVAGFLAFSSKGNTGLDAPRYVLKSEDEGSSGSSGSGSSGSSNSSGPSDDREESEVRIETQSGGVRVITRTETGRSRVDIYEGGQKLRIETRNGQTIVKVENEDEEVENEIELEEGEEFDVGEATEEAELRIKVKTRAGKFVIRRGTVEAETNFPLSIDTVTNELIVTTPAGEKRVAILPDVAVANMLRVGHVDVVFTPPSPSPSPEASPSAIAARQVVEISEEDGEIVYIIEGAAQERFLGLISVLIPKTLLVSAQTGDLAGVRQSLISRILDLLSV